MTRPVFALLAVTYAAFIWFLSSRTGKEIPAGLGGMSLSLLHIPVHGGLAVLLLGALRREVGRGGWPGLRSTEGAITMLLGSLHGIADEVHQAFVPGRTCSLIDVLLDACGFLLVLVLPVVAGKGRPGSWPLAVSVGLVAVLLGFFGARWWPEVDGILQRLVDSTMQKD